MFVYDLKICKINLKFIQIYSYIYISVWYRTRGSFQKESDWNRNLYYMGKYR